MVVLQRCWVLANILEDENREKEEKDRKLELLLQFIDGDLLKQYEDARAGKAMKLQGDGEIDTKPAHSQFYDDVESLPGRRVSKPPMKEDYVARRMMELAGKLESKGLEVSTPAVGAAKPGEKQFTYERRVIPKKKHG